MSGSPISVRARFERFPATVKGAFVIRGEDPDPHQVVIHGARTSSVAGGAASDLPVPLATIDVAPHQDVFVPFELSVVDLPPGWYDLECELTVDGRPGTYPGGRRFLVPWPRGATRRGQVKVGKRLEVGDASVRLDQVDCASDSVRVTLVVDPPEELSVRLSADGEVLDPLDAQVDPGTGRGKVTAYPAMREHRTLRIEVSRGRGRQARSASVEVRLP